MRSWVGADVLVHWHGHNDFGLATASTIAAVRRRRLYQGTINGMGERAGNADICGSPSPCRHCTAYPWRWTGAGRSIGAGYQPPALRWTAGSRWWVNTCTRESGAVATQFHIPEAIRPYSADIVRAERRIVLGKKSQAGQCCAQAAGVGPGCARGQTRRHTNAVKCRLLPPSDSCRTMSFARWSPGTVDNSTVDNRKHRYGDTP